VSGSMVITRTVPITAMRAGPFRSGLVGGDRE
jgi:hypothetical protein